MELHEIIGKEEVKKILREGGTIMITGDVNAGKTTLAHTLFRIGRNYHEKAGFMDLDIGQSSIFLPGTMGVMIGSRGYSHLKTHFIGHISPSGLIYEVLSGVSLLKNYVEKEGVNFTVVDTTGYVKGEEAIFLKRRKIELISPSIVLIIGWDKEMKPLFEAVNELISGRVFLFSPSSKVRVRDAEERRKYREALYRTYFERSFLRKINLRLTEMWTSGSADGSKSVSVCCENKVLKPDYFEKRLVGLIGEDGFTVGCGVVKEIKEECVEVVTPYDGDLKEVRAIKIGVIKVNPLTGEHTIEG